MQVLDETNAQMTTIPIPVFYDPSEVLDLFFSFPGEGAELPIYFLTLAFFLPILDFLPDNIFLRHLYQPALPGDNCFAAH
jgi:hypothetical protein